MEIGDRAGEALDYGNIGTVFQSKYNMAQEYYKKALAIRMEISDRAGGAADYGNLGTGPDRLVITTRRKNITRKHLPSEWKLVTEQEKQWITET